MLQLHLSDHWSTVLLPTKVRLILETWQYFVLEIGWQLCIDDAKLSSNSKSSYPVDLPRIYNHTKIYFGSLPRVVRRLIPPCFSMISSQFHYYRNYSSINRTYSISRRVTFELWAGPQRPDNGIWKTSSISRTHNFGLWVLVVKLGWNHWEARKD